MIERTEKHEETLETWTKEGFTRRISKNEIHFKKSSSFEWLKIVPPIVSIIKQFG